jgi:adenylate kinase
MGRRILFLGPPGAGKGTQAKLLAQALGVPHISTGEMLRSAVAAGTGLGRRAEAIMAAGDLVPDDLVIALVEERLSEDDAACGYLLDGFPRNVDQARALTDAIGDDAIELALLLEVPEDEIVDRLLKRAEAEGRADDTDETIRRRLEVYREETEPLVAHYGGIVLRVDGIGTIEEIFAGMVLSLAEPR